MIELRKLSCGYRENPVLREVSLTFPMGKVVVLLGPNGCGKSTLLRTAMGLLSKQGGEVRFDGVEISALSAREIAKKVAYLSQSRNIPAITARRMVLHGRFPYLSYPRRYRSEDYAIVQRALEQADAADLASRRGVPAAPGRSPVPPLAASLRRAAAFPLSAGLPRRRPPPVLPSPEDPQKRENTPYAPPLTGSNTASRPHSVPASP